MAEPANGGAMLRPSEVSALLGVSIDAVLAWIADGRLPALNLGADGGRPTYRIVKSDLRAFLRSRGLSPETIAVLLP